MKFTNVKQLIIKFMGGGLINFPTRFLRWVKINGDVDSSDDGGGGSGSNSNVFFQLASIQPNRYAVDASDGEVIPIDIENLDLNTYINYFQNLGNINFFYSKEEIAKLGVSLEKLEALECFTFDNRELTENNSISIDGSIIRDNFIIEYLEPTIDDTGLIGIKANKIYYYSDSNYVIMRYAYGDNNNYIIIPVTASTPEPTE